MKRLLLLAPVLALVMFACREKHATTSAPPPAPDPNAYSHEAETVHGSYGAVEEDADDNTGNGNGGGGITVVMTADSSASTSNNVTNSNSDTVVTTVSMPNTQTAPDTSLPRLVVSFISIGQGTDAAARANLDKWLSKHPDVKYEVIHWGREGEVDYRFDLKDRSAAAQQSIVNDVRALIGKNDLVLIKEWSAAHQSRDIVVEEEAPPVAVAPADSNVVRLVVSFISKGEGIDMKTEENFKVWLAERPQFTYEVTHWGREGEVNYCFRMSNIDGRQQEVFVRDVRTFMADKELVIVSEWTKCDKRK